VRALNGARQNRLDAALTRLAEVEESTLAAGGLPGRAESRREHRPGLAYGLPPLIRPKEIPVSMSLTFESSRFGPLKVDDPDVALPVRWWRARAAATR
jgi:hypothetical protein